MWLQAAKTSLGTQLLYLGLGFRGYRAVLCRSESQETAQNTRTSIQKQLDLELARNNNHGGHVDHGHDNHGDDGDDDGHDDDW